MLGRMVGAGAYGRLVKRYPFVKALLLMVGVARWLLGRQQNRLDRQRKLDIDLADDEILVLTREKLHTQHQGKSPRG